MRKEKMLVSDTIALSSFDLRLQHARLSRQNILLVKWLLLVITLTLLGVFLFTPLYDLVFVS